MGWLVALVVVALVGLIPAGAARAEGPDLGPPEQPVPVDPQNATGFLTVMFGRSQWAPAAPCSPIQQSATLEDAVAYAHKRGAPTVGGVVVDYVQSSGRSCKGRVAYANWSDLAALRSKYGFQAVSHSMSYDNWSFATSAQKVYAESCATLPKLRARGFDRGWGLFNYPNNVQPQGAQDVVARCFAFARVYGNKTNDRAKLLVPPYTARTFSVNGGRCSNNALPCSRWAGPAYVHPQSLAGMLSPVGDTYSIVQFYRFVTGSGSIGAQQWDCTSPNPANHWTSQAELYCFNDYQRAIDLIPQSVVVTDPATVASRWGRRPTVTPKAQSGAQVPARVGVGAHVVRAV